MKYLFDNCISRKLAEMLCALGEDAVALRDEFPEDIEDIPWFTQLQGRNLIFISTDTSQLTREHEARALRQVRISALYFGPFFERMKLWPQATWLVTKWPKIRGFAEGVVRGTVAEIKQNGSALVYPL